MLSIKFINSYHLCRRYAGENETPCQSQASNLQSGAFEDFSADQALPRIACGKNCSLENQDI